MKILHVIADLNPEKGGPSVAALGMCEALVKMGHKVSLYTTNEFVLNQIDNEIVNFPMNHKGVKINYFPYLKNFSWVYAPKMGKYIRETIRDFDIVHIHNLYLYHTAITAFYCRKYKIPYIIMPHGTLDPYMRKNGKLKKFIYHQLIENRNLNGAAFVHYTALEEKQLAHDQLGLRSQAYIAPLGINPSAFEVAAKEEALSHRYAFLKDKFVFLFLGRLHYKKGLDLLIKGFSQINKQFAETHLLIVGPDEGGYKEKILQWIQEEGIEKAVTFMGMLQGKDKAEAFAAADAFVLPSYSENFGITVIEAMVSRLPVLISDQVNISTPIKEAEAGLVIQCEVGKLRDAMAVLYNQPDLRHRLVENATNLVNSTYTWDVAIKRLISMYEASINNKHKPG